MIILQDHSIFAIELLEFFLIDFYHNIQLKKRENIDYIDLFPQYKTFKAISALAAAQSPSRSSQK